MIIGERLRILREQKHFNQREIEERSGLLRCYLSRVENGHTVPSIDTLQKWARALDVPLYQLFYDGGEPPKSLRHHKRVTKSDVAWGSAGKDARMLAKFRHLFGQVDKQDLVLIFVIAQRMARL